MNTTLFQILQIIQLKVISYLDTDHLPFLEKGEREKSNSQINRYKSVD